VDPQAKPVEGAVEVGRPAERLTLEEQGRLTGGRPRPLRPILLVLLVAAGVWAYQHFDFGSHLTFEAMRAMVEAHAPYSPLVFIGFVIVGIFLRVPTIMLVVLGGILFERPPAFAYSWIAVVVGTTLSFLLMRYFARDALQRALISRFARLRRFDERLERHGFMTILILRLLLFVTPPLNWAFAVTRVRVRHYIGGTALGVIPGIAAIVFFTGSIANRGPGDTLLNTETLVGAVLVAVLLIAAPIAGWRLLGKSARTPPQ